MTLLRRLFCTPVGPKLFEAALMQPILAVIGVVVFLGGVLYLPTLGPTRFEMMLALLLLAIFALLCTAVGQLAFVIERLPVRSEKDD